MLHWWEECPWWEILGLSSYESSRMLVEYMIGIWIGHVVMTWVKLMIGLKGLWMVDLYMASKFQVFISEIIQGIWKCDTRYKIWVLVNVRVLSLASILLENHILFWGSILCLFMQVQVDNFLGGEDYICQYFPMLNVWNLSRGNWDELFIKC